MRPFWKGIGERPDITELHHSVAAQVLLCVGILTCWIGSKIQIEGAQETAKDLLTESITLFEFLGDTKSVAIARTEIAYCYWRSGELNEARTMLREALQRLPTAGITRGRAILKLVTIENSAARFNESLQLLTDNAALFQRIKDPTTKGDYHNELAITYEEIGAAENRKDYFTRAVDDYKAADDYFRLAKNPVFRASVKNNVGVVLFKLTRYKEAHQCLDEARRLFRSLEINREPRSLTKHERRFSSLKENGKKPRRSHGERHRL